MTISIAGWVCRGAVVPLTCLFLILAGVQSDRAMAGARQPVQRATPSDVLVEPADNRHASSESDLALELQAQLRAANAAERQARSAWAAVTVSGLALVLLIWTLFETRRTANAAIVSAGEARRAAEAAERSAALQSEAISRQLRPYVAIVEKEDDDISEPYSKSSCIQVYLQNFGQTPADDVMFMSGVALRSRPIGTGSIGVPATGQSVGKLAPGHRRWIYLGFGGLKTAEIAAIKDGTKVLLMRLRVEYQVPGQDPDFDDMTIYIDKSGWAKGAYHILSDEFRDGV